MYEILLAKPAEKDLKHLPSDTFDRILQSIRKLAGAQACGLPQALRGRQGLQDTRW